MGRLTSCEGVSLYLFCDKDCCCWTDRAEAFGSLIVRRLRDEFGEDIDILALGTNAAATTAMMKSRANKGATGENAIVWMRGGFI